jgi:mono/diheme cytochrome c family protein
VRGVPPTSAVLGGALLLLTGCGQDDKPAPTSRSEAPATAPVAAAPAAASAAAAVKGKQVWLNQCVACHNADPAKDGPIGPAVKGASKALIEARLLHASYPPGYKPKRDTKVMPARPDLVASIPDLAAYLQ